MADPVPSASNLGGILAEPGGGVCRCAVDRVGRDCREGIKVPTMIRKLKSGQYRLYSRKIDPKTGKRRNLGTFPTRAKAEQHERAVQYFKRRA
jgi:hypothetical protein